MKYFCLSFFLIVISCGIPKDKKNNATDVQKSKTVSTKTSNGHKKIDEGISDPTQDLMVVLNNPNQITETQELIENSGLVWDKLLLDKNALKVGLIRVPADKKDFWLNRLIQSGEFKHVKIYSEKALNDLIEKEKNTLISIRKTKCLGDCPQYNIRIDKEGNATFIGEEYTEITGKQEFKLTDKELKTLKDKLTKEDFSKFKNNYDNPKLMDLPSTFITYNSKQIKVRVWKDAPKELIDVHEYIEGILLAKKYVK